MDQKETLNQGFNEKNSDTYSEDDETYINKSVNPNNRNEKQEKLNEINMALISKYCLANIQEEITMDEKFSFFVLLFQNRFAYKYGIDTSRLAKHWYIYLVLQILAKIQNLDCFTNLTTLFLQHNKIEKIENLDNCLKLNYLALNGNQIKKVENLSKLLQLQYLDLSSNQIDHINFDELPKSLQIVNFLQNKAREKDNYKLQMVNNLIMLECLDKEELYPNHAIQQESDNSRSSQQNDLDQYQEDFYTNEQEEDNFDQENDNDYNKRIEMHEKKFKNQPLEEIFLEESKYKEDLKQKLKKIIEQQKQQKHIALQKQQQEIEELSQLHKKLRNDIHSKSQNQKQK